MAEYSKLAMGTFVSSAQYQVVYLPFVPDQVQVWNLTGINHPGTPAPAYAYWNKYMVQSDAAGYVNTAAGTTPAFTGLTTLDYSPNGISTFSAGLSFSFGAQQAITSITKANPAVVTTAANHGYVTGQTVLFESITGMQQIAGIPFQITVTGATTFTIPWNTNQSAYTAVSGGNAVVKAVNYPFLYAPGVSVINYILLSGAATSGTVFPSSPANVPGGQTYISTSAPHNLVVGSEVAFRIPPVNGSSLGWGTTQLNSLPNNVIPGSPMYGYVISVLSPTQFVVNINSSSFTAFNTNIPVTSFPGLTPPQVLAVGDVNTGGLPISSGSPLYPSPMVNGVSTINGPSIQGAFVNNTRQGFIIGSGIISAASQAIAWEATFHDYTSGVQLIVAP